MRKNRLLSMWTSCSPFWKQKPGLRCISGAWTPLPGSKHLRDTLQVLTPGCSYYHARRLSGHPQWLFELYGSDRKNSEVRRASLSRADGKGPSGSSTEALPPRFCSLLPLLAARDAGSEGAPFRMPSPPRFLFFVSFSVIPGDLTVFW